MKVRLVIAAVGAGAMAACVYAVPPELLDARSMYHRAAEGPAATLAADDLAQAAEALQRAEDQYQLAPSSQGARDLAYVAQRRVLIAESKARAEQLIRNRDAALAQLSEQNRRTAAELAEARSRLEAEAQDRLARQEAERTAREGAQAQAEELERRQRELETERRAREQAEQQAKEALQELDRFAQVKEEERGTVISLPGTLLFAAGQTDLAPAARRRLEDVAEVLRRYPEQRLVIEGHSDSRGDDDSNYELSYFRAMAVKDDLVSKGIPANQVEAIGFGETRPIAPNGTAEGRASNRRVEIVLQRVGEEGPGLGGAGSEPEKDVTP